MKPSPKNTKQHYFLASAKVLFITPDGQPGISEHNCVLRWATRNVGADGIGRVQQLIQLLFRKRLEDPMLEVKDVFIVGLSYLGLMSEAEFEPSSTANKTEVPTGPQMSPLLNPGKSTQPGEIDHVSANAGRE